MDKYVDASDRGGAGNGGSYGGSYGGGDAFYVHYAFPPFATGEADRYAGPSSRREIGHSVLTKRALAPMLERDEAGETRYGLRVSADVLGSDGSSPMASVCTGSFSLMDCGAPICEAVAGIAMGLISDDGANGS